MLHNRTEPFDPALSLAQVACSPRSGALAPQGQWEWLDHSGVTRSAEHQDQQRGSILSAPSLLLPLVVRRPLSHNLKPDLFHGSARRSTLWEKWDEDVDPASIEADDAFVMKLEILGAASDSHSRLRIAMLEIPAPVILDDHADVTDVRRHENRDELHAECDRLPGMKPVGRVR
jgi:hypothetical protein